jgi:putative glycosyltransferase (TIGR04372 family)
MNFFFEYLIKPLNPIDYWDYKIVKKYSLLFRLYIVCHCLKRCLYEKDVSHFYESLKMFVHFIKHLMLNICAILLMPFALIIWILGYRFLHVAYWQIGTLSCQIDLMLKNQILQNNNDLKKIVYLCPKNLSANSELVTLYEEKISIIKNHFIIFFLNPFLQLNFLTYNPFFLEHNVPNSSAHKIFSNYQNKFNKNLFNFSKEKIIRYNEYIQKNFKNIFDKKIITLHTRTNSFYSDKNFTSRNSDLNDYLLAIKYLTSRNYCVIIFSDKNLNLNLPNVFELNTSDTFNKKLQIYLISISYFYINSASGPAFVANLFNTPCVNTNFFPLSQSIGYKLNDITIPKKIYDIAENKVVKYSKIFSSDLCFVASSRALERKNLRTISNDPEEILNGIKEMILILKNKNINSSDLQSYYKSLLNKRIGCFYGLGNISNYFLEKNRELI